MQFREVKLPSGAKLKVAPAPFAESKALYQAILEEAKGLGLDSKTEMAKVFKDVFCIGFSSQKIEDALLKCFARCTYNAGGGDLKIDLDTFEPVKNRQDYAKVCIEVAKENVMPFWSGLFAEYQRILAMTEKNPA